MESLEKDLEQRMAQIRKLEKYEKFFVQLSKETKTLEEQIAVIEQKINNKKD